MGEGHSVIKVLLLPAELWVLLEVLSVGHLFGPEVLLVEVVPHGCKVPLLNPAGPGLWELGLEGGPDMVLGIPHACPKGEVHIQPPEDMVEEVSICLHILSEDPETFIGLAIVEGLWGAG